jgi:hypothetical protein
MDENWMKNQQKKKPKPERVDVVRVGKSIKIC